MRGQSSRRDSCTAQRSEMRRQIERIAASSGDVTGRTRLSQRVLNAMETVPRHCFVGDRNEALGLAYADSALSIGDGQTISQPFIVALMTDLLEPEVTDTVLEVGTGCGYQAAILACLVRRVFTLEIIASLARTAAERLQALGYDNVDVIAQDGYTGWPEQAPYDGIIVTAAAREIPPPLMEQLRVGGRLVLPVGESGRVQTLVRVIRKQDDVYERETVLPVSFVPFTRAMRNSASLEAM